MAPYRPENNPDNVILAFLARGAHKTTRASQPAAYPREPCVDQADPNMFENMHVTTIKIESGLLGRLEKDTLGRLSLRQRGEAPHYVLKRVGSLMQTDKSRWPVVR